MMGEEGGDWAGSPAIRCGGPTARPIDDFESLGPAPDGVHPLDLPHESSERRPASRARGLSVGKYHQVVVSRQGAA